MFFLILPFEWWLPARRYERLNHYVMGFVYSPLLLVTAWAETRQAHAIKRNRQRGEEDDDTTEEWEQPLLLDADDDDNQRQHHRQPDGNSHQQQQLQQQAADGADGRSGSGSWAATCRAAKPNFEVEPAVLEVRELKAQLAQVQQALEKLVNKDKEE
jgi:hypothetical protein